MIGVQGTFYFGEKGTKTFGVDKCALLVNPMAAAVITHDINYTDDIVISPPTDYCCIIRSFNEFLFSFMGCARCTIITSTEVP